MISIKMDPPLLVGPIRYMCHGDEEGVVEENRLAATQDSVVVGQLELHTGSLFVQR